MITKRAKNFTLPGLPVDDFISLVMENIIEAVWVFDIDLWKFVWIEGGERISGVIPEPLPDNANMFLGERIPVEDRDRLRDLLIAAREEVLRTKTHYKVEEIHTKHLCIENFYIPTSVKMTVYVVDGRPKYLFGVTRREAFEKEVEAENMKMQREISALESRIQILTLDKLSKRERECFFLIRSGKSRREIMRDMNIEESTLTTFLRRINSKLNGVVDNGVTE